MPVISVVIPAYNAESTILETIASVQNQTFQDFEIIVVDDGSDDRTLEVLNSIEDKRLKIFSYENSGVSAARNKGVDHSTGEFVAFLDADDLWTPDKLELQYLALTQAPDADIAYSWTYFVRRGQSMQSLYPAKPVLHSGNVLSILLVDDFIYSGSNVLVRKKALVDVGGFDPELKVSEDWECWLRLASRYQFVPVSKYQIFYVRSDHSVSTQVDKVTRESLAAINKVFQTIPPELQHLKARCMRSFHFYCSDLYLRHSKDRRNLNQAGIHLLKAILLEPALLLKLSTHVHLIKFLLMMILSPKIAKFIFNQVSSFKSKLIQLNAMPGEGV